MLSFRSMSSAGLIIASLVNFANAQGLEPLKIALPDKSLKSATTYIAADLGIFKTMGMQMEIVEGVDAPAAIQSGAATWGVATGRSLARASANTPQLLIVASLLERPLLEIVIKKTIAEQGKFDARQSMDVRGKLLKGRNIAVDAKLGDAHNWLVNSARKAGLDPDKDLKISVMPVADMATALRAGSIDGFSASQTTTTPAVKTGAGIVLVSSLGNDAQDLLPFAASVLVTRQETCQKDKPQCAKIVKAYIEAARILRDEAMRSTLTLKKRFADMPDDAFTGMVEAVRRTTPIFLAPSTQAMTNSETYYSKAGAIKPEEAVKSFEGMLTTEFVN